VELRERKGLSEDQRKEVERAMEEARKSVHEALKNLPNEIHIPDVGGIVDKELRLFIDKDGKVIRSEGKMSDEDREKLHKSLDKMREKLKDNNANLRIHMEELHKNLPNIRAFGLGDAPRDQRAAGRGQEKEGRRELQSGP
jgi:ribosome recycling factor